MIRNRGEEHQIRQRTRMGNYTGMDVTIKIDGIMKQVNAGR